MKWIRISDKAWNQGHRSVFLIAPEQNWGQQASDYFTKKWKARGGRVVSSSLYSDSVKDFTKFLKPPLQIDLSEKRGIELRRFVNSQGYLYPSSSSGHRFRCVVGIPGTGLGKSSPHWNFCMHRVYPSIRARKFIMAFQRSDLDRDLSGIKFTAMPWTFLRTSERRNSALTHLCTQHIGNFMRWAMTPFWFTVI